MLTSMVCAETSIYVLVRDWAKNYSFMHEVCSSKQFVPAWDTLATLQFVFNTNVQGYPKVVPLQHFLSYNLIVCLRFTFSKRERRLIFLCNFSTKISTDLYKFSE